MQRAGEVQNRDPCTKGCFFLRMRDSAAHERRLLLLHGAGF
jgi:hypothetical protein